MPIFLPDGRHPISKEELQRLPQGSLLWESQDYYRFAARGEFVHLVAAHPTCFVVEDSSGIRTYYSDVSEQPSLRWQEVGF